jgi:hypothetical protein
MVNPESPTIEATDLDTARRSLDESIEQLGATAMEIRRQRDALADILEQAIIEWRAAHQAFFGADALEEFDRHATVVEARTAIERARQ